MFQNVIIKGVGTYLPKNKIGNDYFIEHFRSIGIDVNGLMKSMKREYRYLADRGETSLSMAFEAAKDCLGKTNTAAEELDMIVFVSDNPEYLSPSNALKLNVMLGAKNAHVVYDMNCNCAAMLVALDMVTGNLKNHPNIKKALIVGSFYPSSMVEYTDPIGYSNFGDAAAAILLENVQEEIERGVLPAKYLTEPDYHENIVFPSCGNAKSLLDKSMRGKDKRLSWEPFNLNFIADTWTQMIEDLLNEYEITIDDISYLCFSQLSDKNNRNTLEALGVDMDKYIFVGDKYGYTGNTSPIFALNEVFDLNMQGYILFCSVSSGISSCVLLYKN